MHVYGSNRKLKCYNALMSSKYEYLRYCKSHERCISGIEEVWLEMLIGNIGFLMLSYETNVITGWLRGNNLDLLV